MSRVKMKKREKKLPFVKNVLRTVYPCRCAICGKVVSAGNEVCENCYKGVERVKGKICFLCGRGKKQCFCKGHRFFYKGIAAPFYYSGSVKSGIIQLKFHNNASCVETFSKAMAVCAKKRYAEKGFDCVVAMPISSKRLNERQYNQSALLAEKVAKELDINYFADLVEKTYDTPAQMRLNNDMRKGNIIGVFNVKQAEAVRNKTVLICDDVATTGATLNECAKMLLLAGAKEVWCLTAAVTLKKKKMKV